MVTDTRSSTLETKGGRHFEFSTQRYSGHEMVEDTEGAADRKPDQVQVDLARPTEETLQLPADVVFPSEHMRMILDAARQGRRIVTAPVYDGSETGHVVYETTTAIGNKRPPMAESEASGIDPAHAATVAEWTSWPVTIAYFNPASETPDLPEYEFTYDLFGNGISRAIRLDYGDFAIEGKLVSLELKDAPPCDL